MARVSDNSNLASLTFSMNKAKRKIEDLQMKGSSLKRIVKPSDDPSGNIELMRIRTRSQDLDQYERNSNYARTTLEFTESSLKDLLDILVRAKEITIAQSSDFYNAETKKNVAQEVEQMESQIFGIANRRLGNRYIFGGMQIDNSPFNSDGNYQGDPNIIYLEIYKDFFVPTNIPGNEVFFEKETMQSTDEDPLKVLDPNNPVPDYSDKNQNLDTIFDQMKTLKNGLHGFSSDLIQDLLVRLDDSINRVITLRSRVGSVSNTISSSNTTIDDARLFNASRQTLIEDADIATLFTDLTRQNNILQAVYKTSSQLLNNGLVKFLR